MEEMKNEKDESAAFLEKENQKEQKQVNYKQVETKDDDKKADVDQEAKCSTRQEHCRMIERPVCDFQSRRVRRAIRVTKEEDRVERLDVNE